MMTSDYPLWIDYLRVFSHLLAVLNATSDSLIYFWRHSDVIIQEMDIAGLMEVQVNLFSLSLDKYSDQSTFSEFLQFEWTKYLHHRNGISYSFMKSSL